MDSPIELEANIKCGIHEFVIYVYVLYTRCTVYCTLPSMYHHKDGLPTLLPPRPPSIHLRNLAHTNCTLITWLKLFQQHIRTHTSCAYTHTHMCVGLMTIIICFCSATLIWWRRGKYEAINKAFSVCVCVSVHEGDEKSENKQCRR